MPSDRQPVRSTASRALRQVLPWAFALAVATCANDQNGPTHGGVGYFGFRPVYGINGSLSQFGIVADSVHVRLTRPVNQLVLDTTVFFPPDSTKLTLALPVPLETSPETLTAVIGISSGSTLLFSDSLDVAVVNGPPSAASIPTVVLDYVGPGKNIKTVTIFPGDTTVVLRDTVFFTASATDSLDQPVPSFFVGWRTSDTTVAKINGNGRLIAPNLRGTVKVFGTTPTGIADTTTLVFAPIPTQILADSGNAQTGIVPDSLAALFVAKVIGSDNLGIEGVKVRWTAVTGGGAVRDTILFTDVNGRVRTRGVLGDTVRAYSWTATVVGTALTTTFTATASAAAPSAIATQSGSAQVDSAGRTLPLPLVARVTDAYGNAVSGAKVYWTRTLGGGAVSADSTVTNASGLASISYTLGAVGTDSITAALAGTGATTKFGATAINGAPATVAKTFGDLQTDTVARLLTDSLVVVVKSATNQPVVTGPVVWTILRGGSTSLDTSFTDVNGRTAVAYTLGTTSGSDSIQAKAGSIAAVFHQTALAGAPSQLLLVTGDNQTDTAGVLLATPLQVRAQDALGNDAPGATVVFTRLAGTGTLANDTLIGDATGLAATTYQLGTPGIDSVRAQLLGGGASVVFHFTTVAPAPAAVVLFSGDLQADTVSQLLGQALDLRVLGAASAPVEGRTVQWTVLSGGGAVDSATSTTDVNGHATTRYTTGSASGTALIEALVVGTALRDTFTVTQLADAPTAIAIFSGDAQTDTVGRALSQPLVVSVTDAFGNPVLNTPVTFVLVSGHGTPGGDTVTSAVNNHPSVGYTLGLIAGTDSIRATLLANGTFVTFTATGIPGAPATVSTVSGDSQTTLVGTAAAQPLVVRVRDALGHPVAGQRVDWSVIPAVGNLVPNNPGPGLSSISDSLGFASAVRTAGNAAGTVRIEAQAGAVIDSLYSIEVAGAASAIAIQGGNGQVDTTGHLLPLPFVVKVTDALGNPITGAKVYWTQVAGSGTRSADSTFTDGTGQTSITYTLGSVLGTDTVRATVAGTAASVDFTAGTVSAAPTGIQVVLGDAQSDTVGATLTDSLVVRLRDGANNPIPNTWLYWTTAGITLSADSTRTDANGLAAVQATLGTTAAKLVVVVHNVDTTLGAVFNVRIKAGKPASIAPIAGNLQAGTPNTPLALPFRVLVQDAHSNLADSVTVTWQVQHGSGAIVPDTAITDTLGMTQAQYTTGPTAGTDTVVAKVVGTTDSTLFVVNVGAGAASALSYLAGTGQSDTIGATLTPFIVSLRDASNNPVAGQYVHFTRIRGTGTVQVDSSLTDPSGSASTTYLLGTVVGLDSVLATVPGVTDTVAFYAQTTAGAPQQLLKFDGDSQSSAIGAALPNPLRAQVLDRGGNPVAGITVDYAVAGGAVSFANASPTSDPAGMAPTGTVTLGASAGSFDITATTTAIPADTVHFTVIALPIGTSKQWTGTLSGVWGAAGNWSPAGIPTAADNVFIPVSAANQPVLDAAYAVGGLQVESGASLSLGTFALTANGATQVDGAMSHTTGLLVLAGSATSARGNFTATRVTGTITLAGPTTVADSLALSSGSLNVGGQQLAINGALSVSGTGAFTMQNPADSVTVAGLATWNGSTAAGLLTAGALVLQGNLSVPTGSAVFQGTGGHTTIFAGPVTQQVSFGAAGLAGNRFGNVTFANANGITLNSNIAATGNVSVAAGVVTGAGRTATLGGGLADPTSTGWNVATTSLAGVPGTLPDTILGNLDVTGTVTLGRSLVVKGNYTQASGNFSPNGFSARIEGTTTVNGTASFLMQNATDSVDLVGAASWNGSTAAGLLTAGTLVLRGNFSEPTGSSVFQATGSHRTILAGAAPQALSFGAASVGGNRFNDLVVANPAGITLSSNMAAAGTASVIAGTLTGSGRTAFIGNGVIDPTGASWAPDITELDGTPSVLPDSFAKGLTLNAAVTLGKALVVKGPVLATNSSAFTLNGFAARFDSTLNVQSSAQVVMTNPADSLDVAGSVSWNGSTAAGLLTNGTLVLRGNFNEPSGSSVFQASGNHTTVLAGPAAQTIFFGAAGLTGNRFFHLTVANGSGITLGSNLAVAGNASVLAGTLTGAGRTVFVGGDLSDPTSIAWAPDLTELDGTPTVLPDSFSKGLIVNGTVTLGHGLAVKGPFSVTNSAVFTLNGFTARIDSSFALTGGAQVKLQNPADTLDIHGSASWNGSTLAGLLTAGTTIFRGNFSEPTGSRVYSATGTHTTVFAGTAAQTVSFSGPGFGANEMHDARFANPAGVQFTSNAAINGTAQVVAGAVTGPTQTITVGGPVIDTIAGWTPGFTVLTGHFIALPDSFLRNLELRDTVQLVKPLVVKGNLLQSQGALTINGHALRIDSALTINGSAQFIMQNAADSVDVGGGMTINGSTVPGLLTDGVLVLRGGFSVPTGATVFQPTGAHRTVFAGAAVQNVGFGAPSMGGDRFNGLEFRGTTTVALSSDLFAAGSVTKAAGTTTTLASPSGYRTLTSRGLSLDGMTFDSVRVVSGGPSTTVFNNVSFLHQDPAATQLTLVESGTPSPVTFANVTFGTVPTTGKVISVNDTAANGEPMHILMSGSAPLDGSAFTTLIGGADGALVDWSHLAFLVQPQGAAVGATLAPISVGVLGPLGDTLTGFAGNVSLALVPNPGNLFGTATQSASGGIATFADLDIDLAGLGYVLSASAPGLSPITSGTFDITVALPLGFTSQWLGGTSTDWNTASNWSAGIVPDSTTNVFISGVSVNAPTLVSGTASINRLQVASGASLTLDPAAALVADSSVQAFGAIGGSGTLELRRTGDLVGTITSQILLDTLASRTLIGRLAAQSIQVNGDLTIGADTLTVQNDLNVGYNGVLPMTDPAALVDVGGNANFSGGSTVGLLTAGTLRIAGDLVASGANPVTAFSPSAGHLTVLTGSAGQAVTFVSPDSANGAHFGRLQVSTTGIAMMHGHYDALGDLAITSGATLADTLQAGFTSHGFTTVDAGGTLAVNNLLLQGGLGVAVGATYAVATTTYGPVIGLPVNPAPYDTLVIEGGADAGGDLLVTGDLRINGSAVPARFDLLNHSVTVNGSVNVNGDGAPVMKDPAARLTIAHDYFTNGASTEGLLTNGILQIAGNFRQAADFSGGAFRASAGHLTRFTAGAGHRSIRFDSPINNPADSTGSKFGDLDLADGIDSLSNNGVFAQRVTLGGSIEYDTTFGGELSALDSMIVTAGAGTVHLSQLDLYSGIALATGPTYAVGTTAFFGGTTLPVLPYQSVLISGPALTMTGDVTAAGSFGVGQTGEVGGTAGDLIVNGHTLHIGGSFATGGFGLLTMATGDSVDVGSDINFNGGNTAGHLTGGTLVGRGTFSANNHSSDSTFVAGKAHRTILMDTLASTIYVNAVTQSGMQFGKLYLLDGAPRTINSFGASLVVQDSLVLGSATSGLSGSAILAQGPVFTVAGSDLSGAFLEVDSTLVVNGSFNMATTQFGGQNQAIPALPYANVTVTGTAFLTDSMVLPAGATMNAFNGDLRINGKVLRAPQVIINGTGTLTMTNPADTVDVGSLINWFGASEVGKLTEGVLLVHGQFDVSSGTSDSSFYATGNHVTRFTDSTAVVKVFTTTPMGTGASRFNTVEITGSGAGTGVMFVGPVWIAGNVTIFSPTIDPITGQSATLGGTLSDVGAVPAVWAVDTTTFLTHQGAMPAKLGGSVVFNAGVGLLDSLEVGGFVHVAGGALTPNGHHVVIHGDLTTTGLGTFGMGGLDTVRVDSSLVLTGGGPGSNFLGGLLSIGGSINAPIPGSFDASPAHQTVMDGQHQRTVVMGASNAFGKFDYSDSTYLMTDVHVRGRLTGSGETAGVLGGVDSLLTLDDSVAQGVEFTNVRVQINESHPLFDVTFQEMNPARTQVTMVGAGAPTPVDLSVIRFHTLPSTGRFVDAVDTVANGDSLIVRMIESSPIQGDLFGGGSGEGAVRWGKLVFTGLPISVDSAVPFQVQVTGLGPDGNAYNGNSLDISLAANPAGDVLGGTLSQGFLFGIATFNDLTLSKPIGGVSFHVATQIFSDTTAVLDSATSGTILVINPAPLGAIIWDGSAGNGLWSDTMNWSTGTTPLATDSVFIPAGQSVTFNTISTVGGLILGQGASLDLQGDLTVTGRVAAGTTITSASSALILKGTNVEVSGTLPRTTVVGTAVATGPVAINGDLTIDSTGGGLGIGSELLLNGHRVDVSGTLFASNAGLFTMTSPADTLTIGSGSFAGGDETGHLTDGVMIVNGSGFDQAFGDPNSFHATGNHTTVFPNTGSLAAVNMGNPDASQFANLKIENPNGVDLNESGQGYLHVAGDLALSNGGVATGDTVIVGKNVTLAAPGDSVQFVHLRLGGDLATSGGYAVAITEFAGVKQTVLPAPYQELDLYGDSASLGANVLAANVAVRDLAFAINGHTLRTGYLYVSDTGRLVMTNPLDTVTVDTLATIQGGDETGLLTAGALVLNGNLNLGLANYRAGPGHLTRFVGAVQHVAQVSIPAELLIGPDYTNHLGTVEVIGGPVFVTDPALVGTKVMGDLTLIGGTVTDSGQGKPFEVLGNAVGDAGSGITLSTLVAHNALSLATPANYQVTNTTFRGVGQHIAGGLPFQRVQVEGSTVLDSAMAPTFLWLQNGGRLDLGGHTLTVDTSFFVNDSAHLVMHDPADSLNVLGTAWFQNDSSEGDFTAGRIRALHFHQAMSSEGKTLGFVQTGANRLAPLAGDTISMDNPGPADSRLASIDFSTADGVVTVQGAWISDSMLSGNPLTTVAADPGYLFVVAGALHQIDGTLTIPRLALGGSVAYVAGTYTVDTTVFFGAGQTIPNTVPYANVAVQNSAVLGGDLDLFTGSHSLVVDNTGDLDLGGHQLSALNFSTTSQGVLTMHSAADTLRAGTAVFGGGSTVGHLTAGAVQAGSFHQNNNFNDSSYAPSGSHSTDIVALGPVPEGGAPIDMVTSPAGSHFNILHVYATGPMFSRPRLFNDLVVVDTFAVIGDLQGNTASVDARGPVVIGPGAELSLGSLFVHDTLAADPTVGLYSVQTTYYEAGAKGLTDGVPYQDVTLDSSFVLNAAFHDTLGTLIIRGTSNLTPNGFPLDVGALQVVEEGTLTMQNAADSVVVRGQATFDGNSTSGLLSTGQLLLYGNFNVGNSTTIDAFAPTGNHTIRFSGSHGFHNADVVNSSNGTSWLRNVVVADTGTLYFNRNTTVIGTLAVADSATLTTASAVTLDLYGAVAYGNDATVKEPSPDVTLNYNFSVAAGTNVTYDIKQSNFYSSTTLPALTYNDVGILDGSHIFMAQDVATSGNLTIASTSAGNAVLDLNGHTLTTNAFIVGTGGLHGQLVMTHPNDSLIVNASANFGGDDESTSLTDGVIRIGGSFTQTNNVSGAAFAATGTRTEFFGTGIHPVGFSSPAPGLSHFADLALLDGGTLQPVSGLSVAGATTIDTSSKFDGQFMTGAHTAEFFGKVNILDLGQVTDPGSSSMFFHDSLIVASTGSYSATNTVFQGTDGIPDAGYTHMYLRQGVHLTLTHPLFMTGGLNIQNDNITGNPADTVRIRLNGHKISANGLGIVGYGRITMDNPADTLEVFQDATFRGVDEDTALSAGVIRIGRGMAQNNQFSARSFAPAGTRTEFYGSLTHQASFLTPGTGESHFADLAVVNTGTLQPLTMFNVAGTTTIGGGAHFNGQLIPLGSVVDFHGPVTVQSGGDFLASTSPAFFNFYGNGGLTVLNGAASPYDVLNTGFVGNNAIPDLPYKNLFLAGKDSLLSGNVTADSIMITDSTYVGSGVTLHANHGLVVDGGSVADQGVLKVDGGTLQADSSFTTQNAGYLVSRNAANTMTVHHATFDGGPETVNLTAGQLNVTGNFTSGIGTSFDADSLFVVNFTGGGNHDLNLGDAVNQFFGELRVTGSGTADSDTLSLVATGDVNTYRLTATGGARIIGNAQQLVTERLAVDSATFQHVLVHQFTTSQQPLQFDNVVFTGYGATETQLQIGHPGTGILDPTAFTNVDFDDVGNPSGTFIKATDTDGISTFLNLQIYGPDSGIGASLTALISGALVSWFPPS